MLDKRAGKFSCLDLILDEPFGIENATIFEKRFLKLNRRSEASNFSKAVKRNNSIHPTSL